MSEPYKVHCRRARLKMNKPSRKIIPVAFYSTETGTEPVREWLKELDPEDRRIIGTDIRTVEFGWPIGMPVCRPMGNGLFEVRSTITGKRIARILFCIHEGTMVLLHGFMKKTRKTPDADLAAALKRKREVEQ
jgi:phage-related protein